MYKRLNVLVVFCLCLTLITPFSASAGLPTGIDRTDAVHAYAPPPPHLKPHRPLSRRWNQAHYLTRPSCYPLNWNKLVPSRPLKPCWRSTCATGVHATRLRQLK